MGNELGPVNAELMQQFKAKDEEILTNKRDMLELLEKLAGATQRIAALEAENCDLRLYLDTIYEKHGELFFAIKQYGQWRERQGAQAPEE